MLTTRKIFNHALNGGVSSFGFYSHKAAGWHANWDGRQEHLQNVRAVQRHIVLIRHGQCNLSDPMQILTEMGRHQANLTGKRVRELQWPVAELITSKLSRAQETGKIISAYLSPTVRVREDDALNEGNPVRPVPSDYWNVDSSTVAEDGARIDAACEKYFHRPDAAQQTDSYTMIVSHANVIRYLICRVLQFNTNGWLRLSLYNGSITWLSISASGTVRLRCFGDAGFMEPAALTLMNFRE